MDTQTRNVTVLTLAALALLCCSLQLDGAVITTVDARSNIFESGKDVATRGMLPVEVSLPSDAQYMQFVASGETQAGPGWPLVGPDGGTSGPAGCEGTNIFSYNGISGILHDRFLFLTGVFLDSDLPIVGQEPERLDFRVIGTDFLELSPLLKQTFFIGDGLTGTGSGEVQRFIIPDGATRLFLGFADSRVFGWPGGNYPFAYADNTGSLIVEVNTVVPEPSTLVMWSGLAAMGLFAVRRRKAER